jgi:hypothetical protein
MTCHIGSNTRLEQGAFGGQPKQSFPETNSPSRQQGSTDCIILLLGVPFVIFTLCNAYAFIYRSSMEPSCTMETLTSYLVYPHNGNRTIEWLCLVK